MNLSGKLLPPQILRSHSTVPNVSVSSNPAVLTLKLDAPQLQERMDLSTPALPHRPLSRKDGIVFTPTQLICSPSALSLASTDSSSSSQHEIVIDVTPTILQSSDHLASPLEASFVNAASDLEDSKLVNIVLDLYDRQHFEWTMIAEPIQRVWGIKATSATILAILQQHGRIQRTLWWD